MSLITVPFFLLFLDMQSFHALYLRRYFSKSERKYIFVSSYRAEDVPVYLIFIAIDSINVIDQIYSKEKKENNNRDETVTNR